MAEIYTNSALLMDRGEPLASEASSDGRRALRVATSNAAVPSNWKKFTVDYPSDTQEIYKFYADSAGTVLLSTVTLNYQAEALKVIAYLSGIGVFDFILRKLPTQKPISVLLAIRSVLGFIAEVCNSIDEVIDSIPGMKQNVKQPEQK